MAARTTITITLIDIYDRDVAVKDFRARDIWGSPKIYFDGETINILGYAEFEPDDFLFDRPLMLDRFKATHFRTRSLFQSVTIQPDDIFNLELILSCVFDKLEIDDAEGGQDEEMV